MKEQYMYPFVAVVGQEPLKKALLIALVNEKAGPLLIGGKQGTSKSLLARSLVGLMEKQKFLNLPLNITEDMLFGSIDIERALTMGERQLLPGLLSRAHGQVLYMDDVNLLRHSLLVAILDTNEQGENILERDGISLSHPVRCHMVGTMNTVADTLPRYILERFGMYVDVPSLENPEDRMEIVRRRIAYERDPQAFYKAYEEELLALKETVNKAKELLPSLLVSDAMIALAAQMAAKAMCAGHRAELYLLEVAKSIAALDGRPYLLPKDMDEAALYVLPHRMRQVPSQPQEDEEQNSQSNDDPLPDDEDNQDESPANENDENDGDGDGDDNDDGEDDSADDSQEQPLPPPMGDGLDDEGDDEDSSEDTQKDEENQNDDEEENQDSFDDSQSSANDDKIAAIDETFRLPKMVIPDSQQRSLRRGSGKRSLTRTDLKQGRYVRAEMAKSKVTDLAFDATIRAAAPYQRVRDKGRCAIAIRPEDMRQKVREKRIGNTFLFAVDASGSMGARERMGAVKGAIFSMLQEAYENRDRVGMIAFRREEAEVLLPITRSVDLAQKSLSQMPTGGKTPLADGLAKSLLTLSRLNKRDAEMEPVLIVVTDGRANAVDGENNPIEKAKKMGELIKKAGIRSVVIDTENDFIKLGIAKDIAQAMGATYYSLQKLTKERIMKIVKDV